MLQDQTTGLMEFSNMCISAGTVDISNTFQHDYRNFLIYIFTHSGIFQHFIIYIEESPLYVLVLSITWILLQISVISTQQQPKQDHNHQTVPVQYLSSHLIHTIKVITILLIIQNKINDTDSFFFFKIQILWSNMHSQNMYIFHKKHKSN